jgi:hypothetical protein
MMCHRHEFRRKAMKRTVLVFALLFSAAACPAAAPAPTAHAELEALLQDLAGSRCEFYRNGSWYPASRAASHLQRKLDYFESKGRLEDAAGFIADGATRSSMSGEAYQVRCPGEPVEPSASWLNRRLEQLRSGRADIHH